MSRKSLNIVLVALALGLGLAIYFSQQPEQQATPLTALQQEEITNIRIEHPGQPTIALEKREGGWWLTEPVEARANPVELRGLLNLAARETSGEYKIDNIEPKKLGFNPYQRRLVLNDTVIDFGDQEPIENRRYARVGDQVFLIADPSTPALDQDYSELVSRQIVPDPKKLTRLELSKFTLTQQESGGWAVSPKAQDKGADAAQSLVDAWKQAEAMWIDLSDEENAAKAEQAKETVRLKLGEEQIEYQVIAREPQLKLTRKDLNVIFNLPKPMGASLFELQPPAQEPAEPAAADTN